MAKVNAVVLALVSGNVSVTLDAFKTLSIDELKKARNTFNEMYSQAKELHEVAAAEAAEAKAKRDAELQAAIESIQATFKDLDLETATDLAKKAIGLVDNVPEAKAKAWTFETATVSVDGVEYQMPRTGNMTQALKDLVTSQGFELKQRAAFIEKFEVKAAADAE